jgi:hypothetical protein
MKIVALLVLAVSLVVGIIGAVTAYSPRLDGDVAGLHLNAPAGMRAAPATSVAPATSPSTVPSPAPAGPAPIAQRGAELTPELLAELRRSGEQRVRVREFALSRWTGAWLFLIGCAGLLGGGLFLRHQLRRTPTDEPSGRVAGHPDPAATLAAMRREVASLLEASDVAHSPDLNRQIIDRIGHVQLNLMPAFIDARPRLVAAFGMAGYARLMDAYAAAERAINRAWSAAADDDRPEAIASLQRGLALLDESARRLPQVATVQPVG